MKKLVFMVILVFVLLFAASEHFTVLVIQPSEAMPEGMTIIIRKFDPDMSFIDSPDAMCTRQTGATSLLCRDMALEQIADAKIYARLPYSERLYKICTGGVVYDR